MAILKIRSTKNYRLFERHSNENRPLDMTKHRGLLNSMKRYGFLQCFPIVAHGNGNGKLIVKDGQHRLVAAETLGLPVHYVEADIDFDIATVNNAARTWTLADYAHKHAANGIESYREGIEFAELHRLAIGTAFALLAGTTSWGNVKNAFIEGRFEVRDREWADAVAAIYVPMLRMSPKLRNARFVEACMAICRVPDFDAKRLLSGAERCREKLVPYSTRDAYLDMLEVIYNFGRHQLVGLKAAALMAMRERNFAAKQKKQQEGDGN